MTSPALLERDLVVVACAISAGFHAALTPDHFDEGRSVGAGFLTASFLLAALAIAVTRSTGPAVPAAAALSFGALLVSYAVATTSGLPLVHPGPEPIEGLAVATKLVEAVGLGAAVDLARRSCSAATAIPLQAKGTST